MKIEPASLETQSAVIARFVQCFLLDEACRFSPQCVCVLGVGGGLCLLPWGAVRFVLREHTREGRGAGEGDVVLQGRA